MKMVKAPERFLTVWKWPAHQNVCSECMDRICNIKRATTLKDPLCSRCVERNQMRMFFLIVPSAP